MEGSSCSFFATVGSQCGYDTKDRTRSLERVPLLNCDRDISAHKSAFSIIGIDNEVDLLLARASIYVPPRNIENWTICPQHRTSLGVGWKRSSSKCAIPASFAKHNARSGKRPKAGRGLSKMGSEIILKETGIFLPVGTGVCCNCRKRLGEFEIKAETPPTEMESEVILQMRNMSLDTPIDSTPIARSTPASMYYPSNIQTPGGSLYLPSGTSMDETTDSSSRRRNECSPLAKLNDFLESRDISPVRHAVSIPWNEASERTRRRHVRKAQQAVGVVLDEVAPNQSGDLWHSLVPSLNRHFSSDSENEDEDVDKLLMNALTECYSNASTWNTRRQILSIMADKVKFQTLKKWIPGLTRHRFSAARKHALLHGRGAPLPKSSQTKLFVSQSQIDHFLDFITSPHVVQDLPFGEKTIKLSTNEVLTVPNVIRMMIPETIVKQYLAYAEESDFNPLSRRTLLNILSVCAASTRKSLQGLDYVSSAGAQAFEDLANVVERLGDNFMGMTWAREQRDHLMSAKRYLKSDYKVHVSKESCVADHCQQYALSDPKDPDYQALCDHQHTDRCDRCDALTTVLSEITKALKMATAQNIGEDAMEELSFVSEQAITSIKAWKAHLLRNLNQDQARLAAIDQLDESSVFLVEDWAMKFLPRKYRESQSDWFGKRGLSWHVTVATRKIMASQQLQMMTFVHVFQSCNQESRDVLAIMEDVIGKLKAIMPSLKTVTYRQDNAGCYRSGETIIGASGVGKVHGVSVKRLDFSDPQGGKGACDRKAATVKAHMRVYLNEGNDIDSASQMIDGMRSHGGVSGVNATLCEPPSTSAPVKFDGVSTVSNVQYGQDTITIWKAYGIGQGKTIQLSNFSDAVPLPSLSTTDTESFSDKFTLPKFRSTKPDSVSPSDELPEATTSTSSDLFFCPEEGCIKSYQRFSALQHHLDCGRHERALESETLLDKAVRGYAGRLEEQFERVPVMQQNAVSQTIANQPVIPMGWALASKAPRTRFNEKQKSYLLDKFLIGEQTGRKVNAASVARSMISARDTNGVRLFNRSEFLTDRQITSYFSRLASKRSLQGRNPVQSVPDDEDDEDSAEAEMQFSDLREEVLQEVQPVHPISFDSYNLCDMLARAKLSTFSIPMLQKICLSFEIPTSDIKARRKAPYLSRIEELLKKCSCQSGC